MGASRNMGGKKLSQVALFCDCLVHPWDLLQFQEIIDDGQLAHVTHAGHHIFSSLEFNGRKCVVIIHKNCAQHRIKVCDYIATRHMIVVIFTLHGLRCTVSSFYLPCIAHSTERYDQAVDELISNIHEAEKIKIPKKFAGAKEPWLHISGGDANVTLSAEHSDDLCVGSGVPCRDLHKADKQKRRIRAIKFLSLCQAL